MNVMFWGLTVIMLLVAIAILVLPLLKTRDSAALAYKDSNLKLNDEKIHELDADLKEGRIDQAFYVQAREELDRELLLDIPVESQQTSALHYTARARRHPVLALLITAFIPMLAMLLYLEIGMHSASEPSFVAAQQQQPQQKQLSVEEMANKLEAHIEKNGGTTKEWIMLARSHKLLGRYKLAADAFNVALETDAGNAQLMLEAAEMIALDNDRVFTAEARELVLNAFAIEPDNPNVLWFAGVAEFQHENYQLAIQHLLKMLPTVSKEEDVLRSVIGIIAQSREKLITAGTEMPELEALLGIKQNSIAVVSEVREEKDSAGTVETSLKIRVDIDADVRAKFSANDMVFVYAKAAQGPRMPLAVQRLTLADLPATVVLDDSMAMVDGMSLSAFEQIQVSARVTKSGAAISQSGDYLGHVNVEIKSAIAVLDIVIDTVVP